MTRRQPRKRTPARDVSRYSTSTHWSEKDGQFVATSVEFPGLSWLAPTLTDAVNGLRAAMRDALDIMDADGKDIPTPLSHESRSGQLRLRMPRSLHASMTERAEKEGVSLNTLALTYLASGIERRPAWRDERHPTIVTTHDGTEVKAFARLVPGAAAGQQASISTVRWIFEIDGVQRLGPIVDDPEVTTEKVKEIVERWLIEFHRGSKYSPASRTRPAQGGLKEER